MTTLVFFCLHKIIVKKNQTIFVHFQWTGKKKKRATIFNGWILDGVHLLKRVSSNWMREEADYPASFCVWDQDQEANPPFGDEREE